MSLTTAFPRMALLVALSLAGCKEDTPAPAPAPTPTPAAKPTSKPPPEAPPAASAAEILATVPIGHGLHYFATSAGNHPTLYLDRDKNQLVVVGRERPLGHATSIERRFAADRVDEAITTYTDLLVSLDYEPAGAPAPKPRDPKALVAVSLQDLSGGGADATGRFSKAQSETLFRTAPSAGWRALSGFAHPTNDAPTIGAGGSGLSVHAPGLSEQYDWDKSDGAFQAFRAAIAKKRRDPAAK